MRGSAAEPDVATVTAELAALRRTARALTGRQDEADDLVQAVFERALPRWHRIVGDPHGYLLAILINLHRDRARRDGRFRRIPDAPERPSVPDIPANSAGAMAALAGTAWSLPGTNAHVTLAGSSTRRWKTFVHLTVPRDGQIHKRW